MVTKIRPVRAVLNIDLESNSNVLARFSGLVFHHVPATGVSFPEAFEQPQFSSQSQKTTLTMANSDAGMARPLSRPIELSFPLPKSPDTRIYLQLTIQTTSILLFLTTAMNGDTSTAAPLGSFVYALPDVR